jgi:hypothetical protein
MTRSETGFGLVVALIMLALLSLLAAGLLTAMTTEIRIGDNYRAEMQLVYLTEAGIEDARHALLEVGTLTAPLALRSNNALIDAAGREAGRYSATLIRTNPLTLQSVGTIGTARKTIEVRLKKTGFPSVPDAITLDEDYPLPEGLDVQLSSPEGLERIVQGIARNATHMYRPSWGETIRLGTTGSAEDYRVVVVDGDCEFQDANGYGVLLVRGELTVSGTFSWNGLVLVIGQGVVRSPDDTVGSIAGALFLARTRDADRTPEHFLGTVLTRRGNVTLTLPPGSVTIERNTTQLDRANRHFPYVATTFKEF